MELVEERRKIGKLEEIQRTYEMIWNEGKE